MKLSSKAIAAATHQGFCSFGLCNINWLY